MRPLTLFGWSLASWIARGPEKDSAIKTRGVVQSSFCSNHRSKLE